MRKIVITGATSMIGIALIEEALERDAEIYAVVRPDTKRIHRLPARERLHIIESDLRHLKEIEGLPEDCDVFYHLAWSHTGKGERDDPALQLENIGYTLDAAALAKRCGCKKFIGAGSQAEYGRVDGKICADTRFAPQTAYGAAKYVAGLFSRRKCDEWGMVHVWGRVFSVYGRYDNTNTMLDYAVRRLMRGEKAGFSAAKQKWDYLYEKDAGKIFWLLGEKAKQSKTYRIASGQAMQLRAYIDILAGELDAGELCEFAEPDTGCPPLGIEADISDLAADIGYVPETDFRTGIRSVIEYYKNNRMEKQKTI